MIEVDRLTKNYGLVAAIRDVSFSVSPGQIVGFLGPNGAGKSTTMRILACFMPATSGVARVAGYDVFRQSMEVRRRIGYLPENVPLYTDMRVAPYLDFVAEVKGVGRAERRRRVADVMDRCMVADVQNRLIGKLSKGYRQRVGLAQAIVNDPEVLILDEPTIGLDPKQITEIRSLIKSLAGARYTVEAARGRDVRAEIFQLAAQQRWELLELKRVGMTLEEVFIRVVAGEESEEGSAEKSAEKPAEKPAGEPAL